MTLAGASWRVDANAETGDGVSSAAAVERLTRDEVISEDKAGAGSPRVKGRDSGTGTGPRAALAGSASDTIGLLEARRIGDGAGSP